MFRILIKEIFRSLSRSKLITMLQDFTKIISYSVCPLYVMYLTVVALTSLPNLKFYKFKSFVFMIVSPCRRKLEEWLSWSCELFSTNIKNHQISVVSVVSALILILLWSGLNLNCHSFDILLSSVVPLPQPACLPALILHIFNIISYLMSSIIISTSVYDYREHDW